MKKIISSIIIFVLTICIIPHAAMASGENMPVFSLSTIEGVSGDIVRVNLDIKNNPGITALQVQIGYSAEDVTLVSVEDKKLFGESISFGQQDRNPFTISWFSSASRDVYSDGTLAVLEFRIQNNAESSDLTISYDQENIFNIALDSVPFQTVNGKVLFTNKKVKSWNVPFADSESVNGNYSFNTNGEFLKA